MRQDDHDQQQDHDHEPEPDPLITHALARIQYALNDLKRNLDDRDGGPAFAQVGGTFHLASGSRNYNICIGTKDEADESPVTIEARLRRPRQPMTAMTTTLSAQPSKTTLTAPYNGHSTQDNDGRRKRLRLEEGLDHSASRNNSDTTANIDSAGQPSLVSDADLQDIMSTMRHSTTSQCRSHLESFARRLHTTWATSQPNTNPSATTTTTTHPSLSASAAAASTSTTNPITTTFPTPGPSSTTTPNNPPPSSSSPPEHLTPALLHQQAELLSAQIQWVEECRRVAATLSDSRTDTWRTTSAAFHDTNRVDRERFQHRILGESTAQAHVLGQILAEVRSIGLHVQAQKWETPASFETSSLPSQQQQQQQRGSVSAGGGGGGGGGVLSAAPMANMMSAGGAAGRGVSNVAAPPRFLTSVTATAASQQRNGNSNTSNNATTTPSTTVPRRASSNTNGQSGGGSTSTAS